MPELRIPLDPCNPAQFYACCGLIELFDMTGAQTLSRFEVDWRRPRFAEFVIPGRGETDLQSALSSIGDVKAYEFLDRQQPAKKRKGEIEKATVKHVEDKLAPVVVSLCDDRITLDWWFDEFRDKTCALKLWPGRATTRTTILSLLGDFPSTMSTSGLMNSAVYLTGRFGLDPRSCWDAVDLGYSPHTQSQPVLTYPIVEMLAAFGLHGCRPRCVSENHYNYVLWRDHLPLSVARLACSKGWDGLRCATFSFALEERSSHSKRPAFGKLVSLDQEGTTWKSPRLNNRGSATTGQSLSR